MKAWLEVLNHRRQRMYARNAQSCCARDRQFVSGAMRARSPMCATEALARAIAQSCERWLAQLPSVCATGVAVGLAFATPLAGQSTDSSIAAHYGGLPKEVSRTVADVWNAPATKRVRGAYTLARGDTVHGDVAVLDGPAKISGVVTGHFVAINADVALDSSARIVGDVTIVGGELSTHAPVDIKGQTLVWQSRLRYSEKADRIEPTDRSDIAGWQKWRRWPGSNDAQGAWGDFFAASAHTYNRVEGLPLVLGPRFRTRHGDTRVTVEAFGIFRTGDELSWEPANLGHRVRAEIRQGGTFAYALGGRLFDEVAPVERWTLTDDEIGLASAVFTRDFRDYYQHHGGLGYGALYGPAGTSLTLTVGRERWGSRVARNPWSLFHNGDPWRINPAADAGVIKLVTLNGHLDTRNNDNRPRSGWFLDAQYERGDGDLVRIAPTTIDTRTTLPGNITYARAFVDLRRYNRLAPNAQLNLRLVAGGVLAGDQLPVQRRFSVSGADALPGYDFRSKVGPVDVGTCSSGSDETYTSLGRPAECDRMLLLQAEWKNDFHLSLVGDNAKRGWLARRLRADGEWVVFMDTGRGWLVGAGDDKLHYEKTALPALRTFRTDLGAGLDFGNFGVYVAQAVSNTQLKPNVFIRLGHRF